MDATLRAGNAVRGKVGKLMEWVDWAAVFEIIVFWFIVSAILIVAGLILVNLDLK